MPQAPERECRFSGEWLVVKLRAARCAPAHVRFEGEVDLAAGTVLSSAVASLMAAGPARIHVDLAAVTFTGSVLPNFLARLHRDLPHAELLLCHPTPMTRRILQMTGMSDIATMVP